MSSVNVNDVYSLDNDQVHAFLPADTWTEVILLSLTPVRNDVYVCSTADKIKEREICIGILSQIGDNNKFEKVDKFKIWELVAVEFDGRWHRGKLVSYNQALPHNANATVELIDCGTNYLTSFDSLKALNIFKDNPYALPIRFKNFVPKAKELTVKPLFSESDFVRGYVVVDVKLDDIDTIIDTKKQPDKQIELNSDIGLNCNVQSLTNGINIASVQNMTNGSALSCSNKSDLSLQPKSNNLPFKSGDYCLISHFEHLSCIYISQAENNKANDFHTQDNFNFLTKVAAGKKKKLISPVVGNVVSVLSPYYDIQFRGKIIKRLNDGTYDVFYIDFGNIENVSSEVIYELDETLKDEPSLYYIAGMSDLKHVQCTAAEVKKTFKNFQEKLLVIEFNEDSKDLSNVRFKNPSDGMYIHELLLKQSDKCEVSNHKLQKTKIKINTNDDSEIIQLSTLKNKDLVYLKNFDTYDNVSVVRYNDAELFNSTILKVLCEQSKSKSNFNVGDIVKVVTPHFEGYRAKITKVGVNLVDVQSIDFGFFDTIQSAHIYELSESLQKIPSLIFKIGLKEPILEKTEMLTKFVADSEKILLCLEFDENDSNGCKQSILKRMDNGENIFDEFLKTIEEPLLVCNGIPSKDQCNEIVDQCNEIKDDFSDDLKSVTLENGDYCIITYFKDFENTYVCKALKNIKTNTYEMHNMDIVGRTLSSQDREIKTNLAVGDLVKVYSPFFKDFYRAKITDIIDNIEFHVFLIDFGNTEIVRSSDIFKLSHELQTKTELPLRVSIDVPPNAIKTDEIENIFKYLIETLEVLSIEFKTKNSNGLGKVLLTKIKSGKSVNEEVLKLLPNEKEKSIKNGEECMLTFFKNFNSIYLIKFGSSQILRELSNSHDCNIKTNLAIGDIVKVKSPSFDDFYRAKVLKIVDNKDIHVFYIDFGNTEVVQRQDVFELSEDLKRKPGIAIKVGIKMPHVEIVTEEIRKFFETEIEKSEILSIEFDDSCETGIENSTLKVISSGISLNNEVLKLLSNQPPVPLMKTCTNEINLKNQTNGHGVQDSLSTSKSSTDVPLINKVQSTEQSPKLNGSLSSWYITNGDLMEFLCGNNVELIHIRSVRLYEENKSNLDQLKSLKGTLKPMTPKLNDIVAVYSLRHKAVYRGKIISLDTPDRIKCKLIDMGSIDYVPVQNVFELPNEFTPNKIPFLSHKVALKGLTKSNYNSTEIASYLSSMIGKIFILEFQVNGSRWNEQVVLKEPKSNVSLNEEIKNKFPVVVPVHQRLEKKIMTETNQNELKKISHPIKSGSLVHLTVFEDFDFIFVREASYEISEKLSLLNKQLWKLGRSATTNHNTKFNVGDKVFVKSETIADTYCRGLICNKLGNNFDVRLIDYGNDELFDIEDIQELPKELCELPDLAIKVKMSKPPMLENNINSSAKMYIKKKYIMLNTKFIIEFNEFKPDGLTDVILKQELSNRSIVDDLLLLFNDPPLNIKTAGRTNTNENGVELPPVSPYLSRRTFKPVK